MICLAHGSKVTVGYIYIVGGGNVDMAVNAMETARDFGSFFLGHRKMW